MRVWVDADACPAAIREILYRAAERTATPLSLVANRPPRVPPSPYIDTLQVEHGFDVADAAIVQRLSPGDLVVTSDIPLAAEVIARGGDALNPRGEMYSRETIGGLLNLRDFMDTLRGSGIPSGGPPPLSQGDRQRFANSLDRWLAKRIRD